jgi:hypothetical protein
MEIEILEMAIDQNCRPKSGPHELDCLGRQWLIVKKSDGARETPTAPSRPAKKEWHCLSQPLYYTKKLFIFDKTLSFVL